MSAFVFPGSHNAYRYDQYKEDRTTVVHATLEDVGIDYAVGALLGQGGFGLVKEGVSHQTLEHTHGYILHKYYTSITQELHKYYTRTAQVLPGTA